MLDHLRKGAHPRLALEWVAQRMSNAMYNAAQDQEIPKSWRETFDALRIAHDAARDEVLAKRKEQNRIRAANVPRRRKAPR